MIGDWSLWDVVFPCLVIGMCGGTSCPPAKAASKKKQNRLSFAHVACQILFAPRSLAQPGSSNKKFAEDPAHARNHAEVLMPGGVGGGQRPLNQTDIANRCVSSLLC